MKAIIVALSLFGMAYAGGYGLETLGGSYGRNYGGSLGSLGGYGNDGHGLELRTIEVRERPQIVVLKGESRGYGGNDGGYGGEGILLSGKGLGGYGGNDGGYGGEGILLSGKGLGGYGRLDGGYSDGGYDGGLGDLDGGDTRHGNYAPMPRQQIRLVPVPVPVKKPYPVAVDRPYTVKIDKPYPVKVERIEKQPYIAKVVRPVIEKTVHIEESKHY